MSHACLKSVAAKNPLVFGDDFLAFRRRLVWRNLMSFGQIPPTVSLGFRFSVRSDPLQLLALSMELRGS